MTFDIALGFTSERVVYMAVGAAALLLTILHLKKQNKRLPPSPPGDPIVGHGRLIPLEYSWTTFARWRKTYGDIIYIHVFGRPMIILNSLSVAHELLGRRSAKYSSRPRMHVLGDMMGWSNSLPFLQYGNRFRRQRRLMQQYFSPQNIASFRPAQERQVCEFLQNLVKRPGDFRKDIHRLVASTILIVAYGYQVAPEIEEDPYINLIERAAKMSGEAGSPGGTLIDLFPILRFLPLWVPGPTRTIKRHAYGTRELVEQIKLLPLNDVREKKAAGIADPSFASFLIDKYAEENVDDEEREEDIRALGAVTYSAAIETTHCAISTFFLLMTIYPEVAKIAQAEIDRVLGNERLPTLDDRAHLPYIDCIMKEIYRFNTPVPLAIPHETTEEDIYGEWAIPKGSMIMPNIWQMMKDESIYPQPEVFSPERYVKSKQKGEYDDHKLYEPDNQWALKEGEPGELTFGFGRRVCPGRFFADALIWMTFAKVLAAFDIRPVTDPATGKALEPEIAFNSGVVSLPKPFKCQVTPRSSKHAEMVSQERYL